MRHGGLNGIGWVAVLLLATLPATSADAQTKAAMTSPVGGSTLSSTSQTFSWDAGDQVLYYSLFVGTTSGARDLYSNASESATSFIVHDLPDDGSTIYVRLHSLLDDGWYFNAYSYTATTITPTKASMTSPANASTLTSTSVTFAWGGGKKVEQYSIFIGSSPGARDYLNHGVGKATGVVIDGLPDDGSVVYVRLHTKLSSGGWQYNDYTYTALSTASVKAAMISPADGSSLSSSSETFTWSSGTLVDRYSLFIGSSLGAADHFNGDMGTTTSWAVSELPANGSTLYVRLWSLSSGLWQFNDYTYAAYSVASEKAAMTSPTNGATLSGSSVTFSWTVGTRVDRYALFVGSWAGGSDYLSADAGTGTSYEFSGLPQNNSTVYVRLWSRIDGVWQFNDYTYTSDRVVAVKSVITSPAPGSTLAGTVQTFTWTVGTRVDYNAIFVGSAPGLYDYHYGDMGDSTSVDAGGLPTGGGTIYVTLWSRINGAWKSKNYSYTAAP